MGICLAVSLAGAALAACSAKRQTEGGGPASAEGAAAQYAEGIGDRPEDDGENGGTASGDEGKAADGKGAENGSGGSEGLTGNREEAPVSVSPEAESEFPAKLLEDTYLNGPEICPDAMFVLDSPATAEGGRFLLSAAEDGDAWCYDEFETLKRYMHGEWYRVPVISGRCGNTSYFIVPTDKPDTIDIEWQWLYGELFPGIYCLEKDVYPQKDMDAAYEDMEEWTENGRKRVCAPFVVHGEPDIQMEVWDITPTGLKLQFTHMPGKADDAEEYNFGSWYELEQYTEGAWRPVPTKVKGDYAWEDLAYLIPAEGSKVLEIGWEWLYGSLEDGVYRIHKSIYPEKDTSRDLPMYTAFRVENCREEEE